MAVTLARVRVLLLSALLIPELALAQSLSVEADQAVYSVGDLITLTVTGDSQGLADVAIWGKLTYSADLTATIDAIQTQHTSFNGSQDWYAGHLHRDDGYATAFNQICCFIPQTVDQLQVATVTLVAEAPGPVIVSFADDLEFFGLDPLLALGTSFTILPALLPPPAAALSTFEAPSPDYVVWPEAGPLEVDPESFEIQLTNLSNQNSISYPPRIAIEAPAALGSALARGYGGSWRGVVLLFDLPPGGASAGDELGIGVKHEGELIFDGRTLLVTGTGGAALSDDQFAALSELEQQPMLRLRPSWDSGALEGFDPGWVIHGVEFELRFTKPAAGDVDNLAATTNGDAAGSLAYVKELTADPGEKRWKVSIASAKGFTIEGQGCVASDCYAGQWSLVDLSLEKLPEGLPVGGTIFEAEDFEIENVVVLGADGSQLNPGSEGDPYFHIHAVDNLVEPASSGTANAPLHWPREVYLGDTVAVRFNTEADVLDEPDAAHLGASTGNVVIQVEGPGGLQDTLIPRAVVELPAALGSKVVGAPPRSQTAKAAFFEVPDTWPTGVFDIEVEYEGALTSGVTSLEVIGSGGAPTDFSPAASFEELTLGQMLRLRPAWDGSDSPPEGFDPSWQIGALEFELWYDQAPGSGEVLDIAAVGNGEAVAGLALTERLPDAGTQKRWKVGLVAPEGIELLDTETSGPAPVGRWALLDLLVDSDPSGISGTEVFTADEFQVAAVRIYGPDGARLDPGVHGEPYFEVTAMPEPRPAVQLAAGGGLLWALARRRRAWPSSRLRRG